MRTVSSLAASSTAIGTSCLGLVVARPDDQGHDRHDRHVDEAHDQPDRLDRLDHPLSALLGRRRRPALPSDMTSTCTVHSVATPTFSSPFTFSARHSLRSSAATTASTATTETTPTTTTDFRHSDPKHARSRSGQAASTVKRSIGSHMSTPTDDSGLESSDGALPSSYSQPHSFLKRLSTFSTSSESRQSSPHPSAAAATPPKGPMATPRTASTTSTTKTQSVLASAPPNKLVKRSASLRPTSADTATSKIPKPTKSSKPTLRRPATSHQRSATLQEHRTRAITSAHAAFSQSSPLGSGDTQWRTYFTPRRRHSTSIPNPIKRVYADRRYRPTLLSSGEAVSSASLEFDADDSDFASEQGSQLDTPFLPSSSQSSVPFLGRAPGSASFVTLSQKHEPNDNTSAPLHPPSIKRSFSISDWLPGEGQTWRRPLSSASMGKYRRRGRASPYASSDAADTDSVANDHSEHPSKRQVVHGLTKSSPAPSLATPDLRGSKTTSSESSLNPSHPPDISLAQPLELDKTGAPAAPAAPHISRRPTPVADLPTELPFNVSASATGSDSEYKGVSQWDSFLDSDHALHVRSSPGRRGPAIDTIFQESPPPQVHGRHTLLRDILQPGSFQDHGRALRPKHSIIHEEEFLSTPARSTHFHTTVPSPMSRLSNSPAPAIASSPPEMPSLLQLRHKEHFSDSEDDSWSIDEDGDVGEQTGPLSRFAHLGLPSDLMNTSAHQTLFETDVPQPTFTKVADKEIRSNIFDWSEQQPFERSPGGQSPPRPKTVHGKKDAENRGSRSVGRRAPSGVHARSQSVPVAQDAEGKRIQVVTNKFGTWGVGSKGVTEDWNEDFDFGDIQAALPAMTAGEEKRLDSGVGMLVPRAIREQQTNVLANIGLLRDWGLLIEEIKELRMRGNALGLLQDPIEPTWKEVEAMIDLADQESDEHTLAPRYSPPSSPSFTYDAFEESIPPLPTHELTGLGSPARDINNAARPASPMITDHEIHITPATPRRPRKDSEAIATSVIEALQQQRVATDPRPVLDGHVEKVHFDTATLRRIIPYVQDLRDRVKGILRDAEGLYASPPNHPGGSLNDASFSILFRDSPETATVRRKIRGSISTTDNMSSDDGLQSPNEDLATRLRSMAVA